jgi:hypothetical protein
MKFPYPANVLLLIALGIFVTRYRYFVTCTLKPRKMLSLVTIDIDI